MKFKKKSQIKTQILLLLIAIIIPQNIHTFQPFQNFDQNFANQGFGNTLKFSFQLENNLDSYSYLRIVIPQGLTTPTCKYTEIQSDTCRQNPDIYLACSIAASTIPGDTNAYFVNEFKDSDNNNIDLSNEKKYYLEIVSLAAFTVQNQAQKPVELYSVSSNEQNFIIQEGNKVFGNLYVTSPTITPTTFATWVHTANDHVPAGSQIDFTFTVIPTLPRAYSILIDLPGEEFRFEPEECTSTSHQESEYQCIQTNQYQKLIHFHSELTVGQACTFTLKINTPQYTTNRPVNFYLLQGFSNNIIEYEQVGAPHELSTEPIALVSKKLRLAWGLELSGQDPADTSDLFSIFKNNGANENVYNTLKFEFSPQKSLAEQSYQIRVYTGVNTLILQNSVSHNLPAFGDSQVMCKVDSIAPPLPATTPMQQALVCDNVGSLVGSTVYHVAIKVVFLNAFDNFAGNGLYFGMIQLHPVVNGQVHTKSSVTADNVYATTNILLTQNEKKYSDVYQGVHSKVNPGDPRAGINFIGTGSYQMLEFETSFRSGDFGFSTNNGIDIYTNLNYARPNPSHSFTTADCYSVSNPGTPQMCTIAEVPELQGSDNCLNLRYGFASSTNGANTFTHASLSRIYGFRNIEILKHSSMYADESFDFYVGVLGTGLTNVNDKTNDLTYANRYLFNAYTIRAPALTNVQMAISNFWTSSTNSVTGDEFPAVLRIFGYFSDPEKTTIDNKLVILSENVGFFESITDSDNVACDSDSQTKATTPIKCSKQDGSSVPDKVFQYMPRVVIDGQLNQATTAAPFQIIIPVSTVANQFSINLQVATINDQGQYSHFSAVETFNYFAYTAQNTLPLMNDLQFPNIGGNFVFDTYADGTNTLKTGEPTDTFFHFYVPQQTGVYEHNSAGDKGASFMFTSPWNFYSHENFTVDHTTAASLSTDSDKTCVTFAYKYPTDVEFPERYNIYCPVYTLPAATIGNNNKIPLTKFTPSYLDGTNIQKSFSSISNKDGYIRKYQQHKQSFMRPRDLIMTSTPISFDFPSSSISIKPLIKFETSNGLPKNLIIKLQSYDGPFNFILNENMYCRLKDGEGNQLELQTPESCRQSYLGESVFFTIGLQDRQPKGVYQIQFGGLNVLNFPKTYQKFKMQILTDQKFPIDETYDIQNIYYSFEESNMSLSIENAKFMIQHKRTRSIFSFTINLNNRNIYSDEKIILDLDSFNHENQNYILDLKIKEADGKISTKWKKAYANGAAPGPLKEIIIEPKRDILQQSHSYTIELHNIYVPNYDHDYGISVSLQNSQDQLILQYENATFDRKDAKTHMLLPSFSLQKKHKNNMGSFSDLFFTIKPQLKDLNVNSFIYIYFPYYYPDYFGTHDPYCEIQGIFTRCEFITARMLTVRDIPLKLPAGELFDLVVSGLPIPNYGAIATFFVALDDDKDPSEVTEYTELDDILPYLPSAVPPPNGNEINTLLIEDITVSDNTWIVQSQYSFKFQLKEANIPINSTMHIEFPREWIDKHQKRPEITCTLDTNTLEHCINFGHTITLTIPSELLQATTYELVIQGFRNPHYTDCFVQQARFTVLKPNEQYKIFARSYSHMTNIGRQQFITSNTNPKLWKWQTINEGALQGTSVFEDQGRFLAINRGTYSQRLRLSLANDKRLNRDVQVKFAESLNDLIYFKLNPEEVKLSTGEYFIDIRIGVLPNVTQGEYPIYFDTEQVGGTFYDMPPSIRILVTEEKVEIPVPSLSQIHLPIEGFSLPIQITMDKFPPYNKLVVESQIPIFPDLRLDYGYVSDYLFEVEYPVLSVYLKSDELPTVDDRATKFQLTLSDEDSDYFKFSTNELNITLSDLIPEKPSYTIQIQDIQETTVGIKVTSTQMVTIYYQLTLEDSLIKHNLESTKESIRKFHRYNVDDINQLQFGRFVIDHDNLKTTTEDGEQNFYIPNLLSLKTYKISFWVEDLMFEVQDHEPQTFTTLDNGDFYFRIQVDSDETLQDSHLNAVACAICYTFQYPFKKVRSSKEIICNQDSLSEIQAPSSGSSSHYFYIYPFNEIKVVQRPDIQFEADDLKQNQNTENYISLINTEIAKYNLGPLTKVEFLNKVDINRPIFKNSGKIVTSPYSVQVQGLQLHNNGIVWAIIEKLDLTIKGNVIYVDDPTFLQVRDGELATGQKAMASDFQTQGSASETMSFSFNNLNDNSHYRIVFYAQSEDPSDYKIISPLFSLETDTPISALIKQFSFSLFLALIIFVLVY